jgi:hypothetical protein
MRVHGRGESHCLSRSQEWIQQSTIRNEAFQQDPKTKFDIINIDSADCSGQWLA